MATSDVQNTNVSARFVTCLKPLSSVARGLHSSALVPYRSQLELLFFSILVLGPAEGGGEGDGVAYQRHRSGAI